MKIEQKKRKKNQTNFFYKKKNEKKIRKYRKTRISKQKK